jgi:two-component system chemotaxis response regulator CheY
MENNFKEKAELSDIIESLEKLKYLLIEYGNSLKEENEKTDLPHLIFRDAHNLKSSLFVINKSFSSKLILAMEALFDIFRKGKGKASQEIIEKCLECIELIKNNQLNPEEDENKSAAFTSELEEINKSFLNSPKEIITVSLALNKPEYELYKRAEHEKLNIFQVDKLLNSDISREDFDNLFIYQDIKEIGFLICSFPSFTEIDPSDHETILKIIFATRADETEIGMYIFDPLRKIRLEAVLKDGQEEQKTEDITKIGLRILLTESDFFSRRLLLPILEEFGTCDIAAGAEEALIACKYEIENGSPYDIITLDILMGDYDGTALISEIRELEAGYAINCLNGAKIIVISSIDETSNIIASFMEQANCYLLKPINPEKITIEMEKMFLPVNNAAFSPDKNLADKIHYIDKIKYLAGMISNLFSEGELKEISRKFFIIKNIASFINFKNLAEIAGQLSVYYNLCERTNNNFQEKLAEMLSLPGEADLTPAYTEEINKSINFRGQI